VTLNALEAIASRLPTVFPVHPRTVARLTALGLEDRLRKMRGLLSTEPLGYKDFVTLVAGARVVATDSGGIHEETTALGIPCLTLRESTERPITVTEGTNVVVGTDATRIAHEVDAILGGRSRLGKVPEGWDGRAGPRAVDAIERLLNGVPPPLVLRA